MITKQEVVSDGMLMTTEQTGEVLIMSGDDDNNLKQEGVSDNMLMTTKQAGKC